MQIGGAVTTRAAKPPKGQKISWGGVWTTKPADSILRPFRVGTGFKWGPRLRGGGGTILTANLMALAPHNYEVGHAIATRKGEPWRDRSHLFRRGKVCNEPRTQAQAASTESFRM